MTELEFDIETSRILAETKQLIEETKEAARLAIDQLTAMLDMATAEHKMLVQIVRAQGDTKTIRAMDGLLKALPSRFMNMKSEVHTLQ